MKKIFYIISAAMMLLSSCASQKSAYSIGGEWNVINLNGQSITPSDETPFLGFDQAKGNVYGFTGCNRLTGSINLKKLANGKPDFSQMGMTRMLCPDDVYEGPFMDALSKVKTSELKDGEMLLKDAQGKVIIILKKK